MRNENRSWKYFGLAALAFTAGAVRWEADMAEHRYDGFRGARATLEVSERQCSRLDAAWLSQCTHPEVVLATR